MDRLRTYLGWSMVVCISSGCPGDDGSGEGESGAATTATSAVDGSASGSATAAGQCGDVEDEQVGPLVSIQVVNMRAEGVWLPLQNFCYVSVPYTFTGPSGPVPYIGPDCGTCQSYAQGNCACPGAACSEDVLLYLEPCGAFEGAWSGGEFVGDMLPPTCGGVQMCGASCQRAVQSPDGMYTFEVQAGASASGCAVEPCACEPFDGRCTIFDPMAVVDAPQPYSAVLEFPSQTTVTVTID